jgi:hypothetical protein
MVIEIDLANGGGLTRLYRTNPDNTTYFWIVEVEDGVAGVIDSSDTLGNPDEVDREVRRFEKGYPEAAIYVYEFQRRRLDADEVETLIAGQGYTLRKR